MTTDQQTVDKLIALRLKEISDIFFKLDTDKEKILEIYENNCDSKKKIMVIQENMLHCLFKLDELTGAGEQLREIKKKLVTIILGKINGIDNVLKETSSIQQIEEKNVQQPMESGKLMDSTNNRSNFNNKNQPTIEQEIQSSQSIEKESPNNLNWICTNTNPKIYYCHKNKRVHFRTKIQKLNPNEISIEIDNRRIHITGLSKQLSNDKISLVLPSNYDNTQQISASYNSQKNILEIIVPLK